MRIHRIKPPFLELSETEVVALLFYARANAFGAPTEIRTLVLALKGLRPGPLDDGGGFQATGFYHSQ